MAMIKVTRGGCGIVYTDAHGNARHALKTPENGPFECDDALAARLVSLGVAEYVNELGWKAVSNPTPQIGEQQKEQTDGVQETEDDTAHLDAEQLNTMTIEQLKGLAADMDVDVTGCKKKADYIAAIVAVEVELGDEIDDDELPNLNVADPE